MTLDCKEDSVPARVTCTAEFPLVMKDGMGATEEQVFSPDMHKSVRGLDALQLADLANAGSDFLLLGNDATALARTQVVARRTRRISRQNLVWAGCYNLLAVPFAAAGWIPPWGAALGMSFSCIFVALNALRLQRACPVKGQVRSCGDISFPYPDGVDLAR